MVKMASDTKRNMKNCISTGVSTISMVYLGLVSIPHALESSLGHRHLLWGKAYVDHVFAFFVNEAPLCNVDKYVH